MYANRDGSGRRFNPGSLAMAVAINGALVGALMLSQPTLVTKYLDPPITIYAVPPDAPPPEPLPPPDPAQRSAPRPAPRPDAPAPKVPTLPTTTDFTLPDPLPLPDGPTVGTATGGVTVDPVRLPPVLADPVVDPRYTADFQPTYPAEERRAEREGRVVVRVLVGLDGRVKQVERVSATTDAFFRTTMERALSKWRFKPGTRDGIPVEAWRTVALRFEMKD